MEEKEYWLPIEDQDGYEVSNLGNVRNIRTGRILKPRLNQPNGYYRVSLRGRDTCVHKLVADAFLSSDSHNNEVRHKDGDRANNRLHNLERFSRQKVVRDSNNRAAGNTVTCGSCPYRYLYDICSDRPDDFYCAYGQE